MLIKSEIENEHDLEDMLTFYRHHFHKTEVVKCENCGSYIAIILGDSKTGDYLGLSPNEIGKCVIGLGNKLLSSRVRLDHAPNGERMMGFQCGCVVPNPAYAAAKASHDATVAEMRATFEKRVSEARKNKQEFSETFIEPTLDVSEFIPCGARTLLSSAETGQVPTSNVTTSLSPFEKHRIMKNIEENKDYKADFKQVGRKKTYDSKFTVEEID